MLREEIPEVLELVPLWNGWVMFGRVCPVPPKYVFFFFGGGEGENGSVWWSVNFRIFMMAAL